MISLGNLVIFNYDGVDKLRSRLPPKKDDPAIPVFGIVIKKKTLVRKRPEYTVMWNDEPGRRLSYWEEELVLI